MKKIICIVITLSMIFSTVVSYGASNLTVEEKRDYLVDAGLLMGDQVGLWLDSGVRRIDAVAVITRVMAATDPHWKYTTEHTFTDVPKWADRVVGTIKMNGIMTGVSATKFEPNTVLTKNDFMTILLRALGYGNNDGVQEFTWNDAFDFALSVGVIGREEYDIMKGKTTFTRADMIV